MRYVYASDVKEEMEFAEKAAKHFAANPRHWSYTISEITPGCLFALRWGFGADCVLVFKVDENYPPTLYGQLIRQFNAASSSHTEEKS